MRMFRILLPLALAALALPAQAEPRHGVSVFGDLKYAADFAHFDWVDPDAPKGGTVRLRAIGTFDTLNPFTLKGTAPDTDHSPFQLQALTHQTLMVWSKGEPDARYASIAHRVEVDPDRFWVRYWIDPDARFHDGTPITAADVAFSLDVFKNQAEPRYRVLYENVTGAEIEAPDRVRFDFDPAVSAAVRRDLPITVASLYILPKAYYETVPFGETTLTPPTASGPYRIAEVDPGRRLVLERVVDWWAQDKPAFRGRFNFDRIVLNYYRDRTVAFEAFKAGDYDFREDFFSKLWATGYDIPQVADGRIRRDTLNDGRPSGMQAFFWNTRRAKFQDRRVRWALAQLFDFEWSNENLFHGLYTRTTSVFQGAPFAHAGPPSAAELALLDPFRDALPAEVFEAAYQAPTTDGSGRLRDKMRLAARLLQDAGYRLVDGTLRDGEGRPFEIEFLLFSPAFERIVAPYVRNLARIGIDASIRIVDVPQFQARLKDFDYDVISRRFALSPTPGHALRALFGSQTADQVGSLNLAGIRSDAVDALIEQVANAQDRDSLHIAAGALDRAVMWGHWFVPQWSKGTHTIAYWDKFGRPAQKPPYDLAFLDSWWIDADKAAALEAR